MAITVHSLSAFEESLDSGTSQDFTWPGAVPAGTAIVPFVNYPGGSPTGAGDNQGNGNTYGQDSEVAQDSNRADIWASHTFAPHATLPLVVSIAFSAAGNYNTGRGLFVEGLEPGNSLDQVGEVINGATVTATAPNSQADMLEVACFVANGAFEDCQFDVPVSGGWTLLWRENNSNSTEGGIAFYRVVSEVGTASATVVRGVGINTHGVIATYRMDTGGGPTPVASTGSSRGGGRLASLAEKAAAAVAQGRAGGRMSGTSAKISAAGAGARAGGRQALASTHLATLGASARAGGRLAAPGGLVPVGSFGASARAGGRQVNQAGKLASLGAVAGAGGREVLEFGKLASSTPVARAGGREANLASTGPVVAQSASTRAGGRQGLEFEAHDNPTPEGLGSTGSGGPRTGADAFDPWNQAERARRPQSETESATNETPAAQSATPAAESATTAQPARQVVDPLLRSLVRAPDAVLGLEIPLEAVVVPGALVLEDLPGFSLAEQEAAAERLALELAEDEAEALTVIEAVLAAW